MHIKSVIIIILLLFAGFNLLIAQQEEDLHEQQIVFISDTQTPIWIEKLYLDYKNNETARQLIVKDIIKHSPEAVFHLGDLVSYGFDDDDWNFVDKFVEDLKELQIHFFPTLGNHELLNLPFDGEANFIKRFPEYIKTGYTRIIGSTAIILLNSNFDHLSDFLISKQQEWFKNELSKLNLDISIKHIVVGTHHPPFTNSSMVSGSEEVLEQFVSQFSLYDKCRLFISGHAHRIEHFIIDDKNYVVAGGGGGMQHPTNSDEIAFYDHFPSGSDLRPFHYICLTLGEALSRCTSSFSRGKFAKGCLYLYD